MASELKEYFLWRKLGTGGFGEVWQALDPTSNKHFAVKILTKTDGDSLKRFKREIKILSAALSNPFIVKVHDYNLKHDPPFYVMEYCEGGSLESRIGQVNPKEAVVILIHVFNALYAIHQAGGFHRDIKPHNILQSVDESGKPIFKLSDFGLARIPQLSPTFSSNGMGTLRCMSPELIKGGKMTSAADIYSLGITAFELLTGKAERQMLWTNVPVSLANLLYDMTAEQPSQRPTMQQLNQSLGQIYQELNTPTLFGGMTRASGLAAIVGGGLVLLGLLTNDNDE